MLPSCFLKVSAHTELLLVHGSGCSCLQPFHKACLYTSWCPLGVLPSTDNCWLYISCSQSPVESCFTVQFLTVKDNHHHPSEDSLYQAASNQIPTSLVDRGKHLNWGWQDLESNSLCIGTPRAASIHSRLWTWQAVSTTDFSPKHLFPQAFLFQTEGLLHETKNWLLHQRCY